MFIRKLILKGNQWLMLNNINHFEYTPESPYQVILGTNGSGKSTVLSELNPLPANLDRYVTGGSKEIHIEHNGMKYILTSVKTKSGGKHSFLRVDSFEDKVGEEYNQGGTQTVQKEIVFREFGVWDDLIELLLDRRKFSDMPPGEKRDWITRLSSVDYTYPMGVFDRLKVRARDTQGALKHDKQRLGQETQNLQALGDLQEIKAQAHQWREELNALLLSRPAKHRSYAEIDSALNQLQGLITIEGNRLLRTVPSGPRDKYVALQDVQSHVSELAAEIRSLQSLYEYDVNEYQEMEKITQGLQGESLDVGALEARISDLGAQIELQKAGLQVVFEMADPSMVWVDCQTAVPALAEVFHNLADNTDRIFSKDAVAQKKNELLECQRRVDTARNRLTLIDQSLEKMQHAKQEQCPECGYIWIPGYSELQEKQYIADKEFWEKDLDTQRKDAGRMEEYLEQAQTYTNLFQQFRHITQTYPRLKPLWDIILDRQMHLNGPKAHIPFLYSYMHDAQKLSSIEKMRHDLDGLQFILDKDKASKGEGSAGFAEHMKRLRDEIQRVTDKLRDTSLIHKERSEFARTAKIWEDNYTALKETGKLITPLYAELIEAIRVQELDKVITKHQNALAFAEQKITKQTTLQGIVADLEKSHEGLVFDMEAFKAVLKALSPTEGLIADQLNGFIGCLTDQMNSVLASVWTYDLKVMPCANNKGELDYKFPILVHTQVGTGGSTAQTDIIDFSFKVTVMLYLGLKEFPLYLDELGASFDEQHRTNVMNFVKRLVDTGYHRQVFLVSHYAVAHGAFTNGEVLVMDPRNIMVPDKHNEHVVMA
jgi:hypothetical protein